MNHQIGAGAAVGAVEGVGIADVDREIIMGVRIELRRRDRIEAFRRLAVALLDFRPELARPAADRIGREQRQASAVVLLPDFELGFLLEQADQDRGFLGHVLALELDNHRGRQWLERLGGKGGKVNAVGLAAGQHRRKRKRSRGDHASDPGRTGCQRGTPHRSTFPIPSDGYP